jgi:hypothetical protein
MQLPDYTHKYFSDHELGLSVTSFRVIRRLILQQIAAIEIAIDRLLNIGPLKSVLP